jgi:hypothetical protein
LVPTDHGISVVLIAVTIGMYRISEDEFQAEVYREMILEIHRGDGT